jgi:N-acetylglucosaminyldiphosphoundecaprenol N-acetyl-beta-D-mannosaminyltransferase
MRVKIAGMGVDDYSFAEVVQIILKHIDFDRKPQYVVTPNAQHIVLFQTDLSFRQAYKGAFLVVPDGVPLLWAAKILNTPLKDRVNGTDLFEYLCKISATHRLKVFFLGGRVGTAEKAATVLKFRYPGLDATTYCPPHGFEVDSAESQRVDELIKAAAPDFLFVGLGAPKQELWIRQNYQRLNVPISIGIGGSFDLVAGTVKRAPKIMQKMGLEWFFRLLIEPHRLWKRYVFGNTAFIYLIAKQKFES